jgi:phospholipid/cholesterol/gamma-HCH transport system substrate-binding protein
MTGLRRSRLKRGTASGSSFGLGLCLYLGLAVLLTGLAFKPQILGALATGDKVTAEFATGYKLRVHDSSVKVAGITVGSVEKIEKTDDNTVLVTMKVDHDTMELLGDEPTARIEPRTILGGRYAIEIKPGGTGEFNGAIPLERTGSPVELDRVVEAFPATAREALQGLVGKAGQTLSRSDKPLGGLLETVPPVFGPAAGIADAARGTRPERDLPDLVANLSTTADVLSRRDGQLDSIVANLHATSVVLAQHRGELSQTLANLPATVTEANAGLTGLNDSVERLTTTAKSLRPSAPEIVDLVAELDPALSEAVPLMRDLKPLLRDARPAVRQLVPVAQRGTSVLGDLEGPVLDRVNGPVVDFVMNPWDGTGPFAKSALGYQADHTFYEEVAYMATNIDRASMTQDHYGSTLAFQAGAGVETITDGLPFSLENIVKLALNQQGIDDPALRKLALHNAGVSR